MQSKIHIWQFTHNLATEPSGKRKQQKQKMHTPYLILAEEIGTRWNLGAYSSYCL